MIANFFTGSLLIYPFDDTYSITSIYVGIVLEGLVALFFARSIKFRSEIEEQISSFVQMADNG
jgi:hypothetical protein